MKLRDCVQRLNLMAEGYMLGIGFGAGMVTFGLFVGLLVFLLFWWYGGFK